VTCALPPPRWAQEDAHAVVLDVDQDKTGFFGVFDGHGGKEVAKFAAKHLVRCRAAAVLKDARRPSSIGPQSPGRALCHHGVPFA
jgi:serine/threonine protein phosphatase PrpC